MFSSVFACGFFSYLVVIWLSEVIRFLGFYAGMGTALWVWPGLLAAGIGGVFLWPWIRKRNWNKTLHGPADLAVVIYFCLFALGKMVFPDVSEDVLKYHVFLQEPPWKDMISCHLLPGGIQGFGFPLGDRLFYLFRQLLGYRMGTVANLLCLLLLYCQVRQIMRKLCKVKLAKLQPLLCFVAVAQYDALMQMGSYMVELTGAVLLMESIWFLLREPEDKKEMVVFASLLGFLFGVKMTNVIYVIPLLILYIYKNRKEITAPLFGICFLAGALPVSIYLIHNWIQAGNPVYPYYNSLFRSPYFGDFDFKDKRWGGTYWTETVLWPWLGIIRPDYRQSELPAPYTWGYGAAWMLTAFYMGRSMIACLRKEKKTDRNLEYLTILTVVSSFLWSFTTGHIRYYMAGYMVLVLVGISAGVNLRGETRAADLLVMWGLAMMIPGPLLASQACISGREWSFRPGLGSRILPGGIPANLDNLPIYKEQWKQAGRDRKIGTREQREKPEKLLLFGSDSALAVLLNPGIPVISWEGMSTSLKDEVYLPYTDQMEEELETSDRIYSIMKTEKGASLKPDGIYEQRMAIDTIEPVPQEVFPDLDVYLLKLKGPKDPENHLNRQRAVGVLGTEEAALGQTWGDEPVRLWIESPGLKEAPDLAEDSLRSLNLKILEGEERNLLKELELDLREQNVYEISLDLDREGRKTELYGILEVSKEDEPLADYARVWVRTSLDGKQKLAGYLYYTDESGLVKKGWVEDEDGRYYTNGFGRLYTGWEQIDGIWYHFSEEDGSMDTGWLFDDFYLREDGSMVTGTEMIDGITYRFDRNGHLIK